MQAIDEFIAKILFTKKANIYQEAIINFCNYYIWTDNNPHGRIVKRHQQ